MHVLHMSWMMKLFPHCGLHCTHISLFSFRDGDLVPASYQFCLASEVPSEVAQQYCAR